jgi:hypothetical protein
MMTVRLSPEGVREILEELEKGSPDTPERRAAFERARAMSALVERELEQAKESRGDGWHRPPS